jgi:hypothetical protein
VEEDWPAEELLAARRLVETGEGWLDTVRPDAAQVLPAPLADFPTG